ncbi:hypothetical protein G210_2632 [Candida maltosa Xu316]|uniref:Uncharacterized protein n=1 Tax=Candida maltosa (strain Xu316) TaxID=1245528 RepID=M3HID9_CANMX|nr:hypothetical protein G210_2632 [Candida maltosa Xu316]
MNFITSILLLSTNSNLHPTTTYLQSFDNASTSTLIYSNLFHHQTLYQNYDRNTTFVKLGDFNGSTGSDTDHDSDSNDDDSSSSSSSDSDLSSSENDFPGNIENISVSDDQVFPAEYPPQKDYFNLYPYDDSDVFIKNEIQKHINKNQHVLEWGISPPMNISMSEPETDSTIPSYTPVNTDEEEHITTVEIITLTITRLVTRTKSKITVDPVQQESGRLIIGPSPTEVSITDIDETTTDEPETTQEQESESDLEPTTTTNIYPTNVEDIDDITFPIDFFPKSTSKEFSILPIEGTTVYLSEPPETPTTIFTVERPPRPRTKKRPRPKSKSKSSIDTIDISSIFREIGSITTLPVTTTTSVPVITPTTSTKTVKKSKGKLKSLLSRITQIPISPITDDAIITEDSTSSEYVLTTTKHPKTKNRKAIKFTTISSSQRIKKYPRITTHSVDDTGGSKNKINYRTTTVLRNNITTNTSVIQPSHFSKIDSPEISSTENHQEPTTSDYSKIDGFQPNNDFTGVIMPANRQRFIFRSISEISRISFWFWLFMCFIMFVFLL